MKIYLAGSIAKGDEEAKSFDDWRKKYMAVLAKYFDVDFLIDGVMVEDWIHPFIGAFSDFVIERIEDIATIKDKIFSTPIKDITVIDAAVAHREQTLEP